MRRVGRLVPVASSPSTNTRRWLTSPSGGASGSHGKAGPGEGTSSAQQRTTVDKMLSSIRAGRESRTKPLSFGTRGLSEQLEKTAATKKSITTTTFVDEKDASQSEVSAKQELVNPKDHAADDPEALTLRRTLLDDSGEYFPALRTSTQPARADEKGHQDEQSSSFRVPGEAVVPPGFIRYRLDLQYQGQDFNGWFKTSIAAGVAGAAASDTMDDFGVKPLARTMTEDALAVAFDVDRVSVTSSVLPEAGAHVRRLPCHVDVPADITMQPRTILQRASIWLEAKKAPLAILSCHRCKNQSFHARHSGVRRVYVYRILNRVAPPLFDAGLQWHVDRHLDTDRMSRFAKRLEGTMDFGYFADAKMAQDLIQSAGRHGYNPHLHQYVQEAKFAKEQASGGAGFSFADDKLSRDKRVKMSAAGASVTLPTIRTIDSLNVTRKDDEVLIWFVGKSFLRRQIRNMVSLLRQVGHGQWTEQDLDQALREGFMRSVRQAKRERLPPAPAHGLTLWDVEYLPIHASDYVPFVDSGPYEAEEMGGAADEDKLSSMDSV